MRLQIGELHETHAARLDFSILEEEYGGNVAHTVFGYNLRILINVEFAYYYAAVGILLCQFLHNGTELDAGTTP